VPDGIDLPVITAFRLLAVKLDARHPILLKDTLIPSTDARRDFIRTWLTSATNIGALLCDGIGDAILVQGERKHQVSRSDWPTTSYRPPATESSDRLRCLSVVRPNFV